MWMTCPGRNSPIYSVTLSLNKQRRSRCNSSQLNSGLHLCSSVLASPKEATSHVCHLLFSPSPPHEYTNKERQTTYSSFDIACILLWNYRGRKKGRGALSHAELCWRQGSWKCVCQIRECSHTGRPADAALFLRSTGSASQLFKPEKPWGARTIPKHFTRVAPHSVSQTTSRVSDRVSQPSTFKALELTSIGSDFCCDSSSDKIPDFTKSKNPEAMDTHGKWLHTNVQL